MITALDAALTDTRADFRAQVARTNRSLADCKALIASLEAQIVALEEKMKPVNAHAERNRAVGPTANAEGEGATEGN